MNIIEAIKSGKPTRRKSLSHLPYGQVVSVSNGAVFTCCLGSTRTIMPIDVDDILADDWEIELTDKEKLEIAREGLNELKSCYAEHSFVWKDITKILEKIE